MSLSFDHSTRTQHIPSRSSWYSLACQGIVANYRQLPLLEIIGNLRKSRPGNTPILQRCNGNLKYPKLQRSLTATELLENTNAHLTTCYFMINSIYRKD